MDRIKDSIDEKANIFGYIPYYEALLRDREYRDMARSTEQLQELDPRRKRLITINPYIAKYAKLPPEPNIEQKMFDDFTIDLIKEANKMINQEDEKVVEPQDNTNIDETNNEHNGDTGNMDNDSGEEK